MKNCIPKEEFRNRVNRVQKLMEEKDVDVIIAFSNNAEPQYLRFFTDFRVSFETAAVAIPKVGNGCLLVGPETLVRAINNNPLQEARKMMAFRESAAPAYEDPTCSTFEDLFSEYNERFPVRKVGLVGYHIFPLEVYLEIEKALKNVSIEAEIVKADEIVDKIRSQKSKNEIEMIRKSAEISSETMKYVLKNVRAGMTGEEVRGIALAKMIELGAEGEGFPMWVIKNEDTENAISVSCKESLEEGDLVQIQLGASYNGYSSACGRPIVIGKANASQKAIINECYEAKLAVEKSLKTAKRSGEVAKAHRDYMISQGHENRIVYGPCHSVGLVECEAPWIESGADYDLIPGMTFCTDVFVCDTEAHRGIRFEDMIMITENGYQALTDAPSGLIEIM